MSFKPLQKFLAISIGIHLLLFLLLGYYLPPPKLRRNRPLLVEVLPLPKPEKQVKPEKQAALSDASRKVKKETRKKELPRPGANLARLPSPTKPKPKSEPKPTPPRRADEPKLPASPPAPPPVPPAPKEEVKPVRPAPSPPEEVKVARQPPSRMLLPRPEPSSPPKEPAKKEVEIALPKLSRPEEMPVKPEVRELPAITSLPAAPQVGQAPSLAKEIAPTLKEEPAKKQRERVDIARTSPPPSLLIKPSEKPELKPLPSVRQLIPSAEKLARVPPRREKNTVRELPREETVSLNTKEFKYYSYFVKLKQRIENVWNYPYEAQTQGQQGQLFMEFTIARSGVLEKMQLLRSSQYTVLDVEALKAVRVALEAPLPLPEEWGLDRINVRASFTYHLNFWNPVQ